LGTGVIAAIRLLVNSELPSRSRSRAAATETRGFDMTRFDQLKAVLHAVDTSPMTTPEVVLLCEMEVPGCTVDEIIAALRQVGIEQLKEAEQLKRYAAERQS
jgi:hypothetical protein